ncbi:MAG TPA: zinc ribbon domain-containing protein [bacterium]|nr:zinc ribbon domain-containing protein [bacterium]
MPIYEYKCNNCGSKFEEFQSVGASNETIVCPKCKTPKPERIFSIFGSGSSSASSVNSGCSSSGPFT